MLAGLSLSLSLSCTQFVLKPWCYCFLASLSFAGFVSFMSKDVPDAHPLILESELRCLVQFLTHWKTAASQEKAPKPVSIATCYPTAGHWHDIER